VSSCLGIYIEERLIKYAKVVKEKDSIKIEAFNVEFYENLKDTLSKIIEETNSEKTPISINISNELYNYFDVFAMLSKKDMQNSIDLEFEEHCSNKGYNKDAVDTRYILIGTGGENERFKVLHVAANKTDIAKKTKDFGKNKISYFMPISTSITNLIDVKPVDNLAIVNIEKDVKITTIVQGQIFRVDILENGMSAILDEINQNENSMKKTYEICKNITIYNQDNQKDSDSVDYATQIMPYLNQMVADCKKVIEQACDNVNKIYITGLGIVINNLDLYFQEYIPNAKCELLKPYFIESASVNIPLKEYLEVSSAVALALDGLGFSKEELNFATKKGKKDIKSMFSNFSIKNINLDGPLNVLEKLIIRGISATVIVVLGFIVFSTLVINRIETQKIEVSAEMEKVQQELAKMENDFIQVQHQTVKYKEWIDAVNKYRQTTEEIQNDRIIAKNAMPNLLNKIENVIPEQVQLISVYNDTNDHIVIKAQAKKYEQLGYFKALIETERILVNVKETSGYKEVTQDNHSKENTMIMIIIEGELP